MTNPRLYISPTLKQVTPENGIGRVVLAQNRYLPGYGFDLTEEHERADLVICHINRPASVSRVDALHLHGLYFSDIPQMRFAGYHHQINASIVQSIREARAITVPSDWVAMCLKRDMRITPQVIGHGLDLEEWKPDGDSLGYVLWNKSRMGDVCDPYPAYYLAKHGINVLSTFAPLPDGADALPNLHVTGVMSAELMRTVVARAGVYLSTTLETFGIGTLEAMACGIPVLGYAWGGTEFLVRHGVEGYLVSPGDLSGLLSGLEWINKNRQDLSKNAIKRAQEFTWSKVMGKYAEIYRNLLLPEPDGVAVLVPVYNYASYLPGCVESIQSQAEPPKEIILVDDGSTDNSHEVITKLAEADSRIIPVFQENQGVAAARNHGIQATAAPYIICLDPDDRIMPEYIKTCHAAIRADRSLGIVYTGLLIQGEGGQPIPSSWPPEFDWEGQAKVSVPPSNCIPCAAMFRREMWERAGGYKQVYAPAEDAEFWTRGLSVGFNARKVSNAGLFLYQAHSGSASRRLTYHAIDQYHPWMRDKEYPMGAPQQKKPKVRSYVLPTVSVIIPVGPGHLKYLPAALDSLLGQTFRNWEVIVVWDEGPVPIGDGTEMSAMLATYPFIHFMATPKAASGAGAARNIGLQAARAPLTLFLDADDWLAPTALESMLRLYVQAGGRYVYTDWVAFEDGKAIPVSCSDYSPTDWLVRVVDGEGGGMNAVTVLIDTLKARDLRFDEDLPVWEDSDFFARCAVTGVHGVRLAQPLLYYRVYSGSRRMATKKYGKKAIGLFKERYEPYLKGEIPMPGCCGGSGDNSILAAKRALGLLREESVQEKGAPAADNKTVRMEFIGETVGGVWYRGMEGSNRQYRGGKNPMDRFADVNPLDVDKLEMTGLWRRVTMPVAMRAPTEDQEAILVPQVSESQLRAQAEEALNRAKAEAARFDLEEEVPAPPEPPAAPVAEQAPVAPVRRKERKKV
jgi:glycosyltransferase involved in cell wall biosynthesis